MAILAFAIYHKYLVKKQKFAFSLNFIGHFEKKLYFSSEFGFLLIRECQRCADIGTGGS
ncbi:unnamed protein product, partial [Nesidiocoris tenuis]